MLRTIHYFCLALFEINVKVLLGQNAIDCGKLRCPPDMKLLKDWDTCLFVNNQSSGTVTFEENLHACEVKGMRLSNIVNDNKSIAIDEKFKVFFNQRSNRLWLPLKWNDSLSRYIDVYTGNELKKTDYRGHNDMSTSKVSSFGACVAFTVEGRHFVGEDCTARLNLACEAALSPALHPQRPNLTYESDDPAAMTVQLGENVTFECRALLNGFGTLLFVILSRGDGNDIAEIRTTDSRVVQYSEEPVIGSKPEECLIEGQATLLLEADKSLNNTYVGCSSFKQDGVDLCSSTDRFCTLSNKINIVEYFEELVASSIKDNTSEVKTRTGNLKITASIKGLTFNQGDPIPWLDIIALLIPATLGFVVTLVILSVVWKRRSNSGKRVQAEEEDGFSFGPHNTGKSVAMKRSKFPSFDNNGRVLSFMPKRQSLANTMTTPSVTTDSMQTVTTTTVSTKSHLTDVSKMKW